MTLDDDKLDRLLAKVEVPSDLKQQLRAIAEPTGTDSESKGATQRDSSIPYETKTSRPIPGNGSAKSQNWRMWTILIAASLIVGLGAWAIWSESQNNQPLVVDTDRDKELGKTNPNNGVNAQPPKLDPELAQTLDDLNSISDEIERLTLRLELAQKAHQLERLESELPRHSLSHRDRNSLAIAMAAKSALEIGASRESVQQDWQWVSEQFPNSSGASLIQSWQEQNSKNQIP